MHKELADVQSGRANHEINIDHVGIKGLKYPIRVYDKVNKFQHTVAEVSMYVDLPIHYKGTHMSRFVEILSGLNGEISVASLRQLLGAMKERLNAERSHIEFSFPYFIEKASPVTKSRAFVNYDCRLTASLKDSFRWEISIRIPVHTLCPCSKEISTASAHNQRSYVSVTYSAHKVIWLEDIVELVERNASAPVYSYLKRPDEKFITEYAYEHPMFVEDLVRAVAAEMGKLSEVTWFKVEAENMESIHNHNAYASIERKSANE